MGGGLDSKTSLLLHLDGTDGSTTITDSSIYTNVCVVAGAAQIDTAQSKFGGASGYQNTTPFTGHIHITAADILKFGSGSFTVDFWVRFEVLPTTGGGLHDHQFAVFAQNYTSTPGAGGTILSLGWNGSTYFWQFRAVDTALLITWNTTVVVDTWYHIALVRDGNTWYLFQAGTALTATSSAGETVALPDWTGFLTIFEYDGLGWYLHGWIDELRMSKGVARWIANFTPPTAAYDSSNDVHWVSNLYLRIRDLLNEDTASFWTDAELLRYINDAERDIAIKSLSIQHVDALTTSNGSRTVSFNGYKTMYLEYVKSNTLGIGVNNILSSQWGHTPSLETDPQNWFERGTNLYIEPVPTAELSLKAYIADYPLTEVSADTDLPEIPMAFRPLIVLYVVAMCLFKDRRYAQAQQIYSMYMNELLYLRYTLVDIIPDVKAATNFHDFNKVT